LPEILVSSTAAFSGSADIAAGNAFGSIICNTAFIAGLTQLVRPTAIPDRKSFGWRMFFFYAAAVIILSFGLGMGRFEWPLGLILLATFFLYAYWNIRGEGTKLNPTCQKRTPVKKHLTRPVVILIVTAAMLFVSARLLVDNGIVIAQSLGVPERVIGVTFIALGTSLPELVTAITSLIKGHGAVSIGNILGANLLNFLLVIGIPATVCGIIPSSSAVHVDLPVAMGVMALLTVPMLIRKKGTRIQGALLIIVYCTYCFLQF
jgi:cation:H+ antiporter